jgi:uncharacterized integral membrane protein
MKRLIRRLVVALTLVPLAIAVLALATINRQEIPINLDPFACPSPECIQVTAPLDLVVLLAIAVGVILGSVVTYVEQGRHRRAARQVKGEMHALKAELTRLTMPRPGEKQKVS